MSRHRAPSPRSRALTSMAVAGAALGVSVLTPATAIAAPVGELLGEPTPDALLDQAHHDHHDRSDGGRSRHHHAHRAHAHHLSHPLAGLRPMSSGEEQYRNGCRQGYINQGCEEFSVPNLVKRGISPVL